MDSRSLHLAAIAALALGSASASAETRLPSAILSVRNPPTFRDCVDEPKLAVRIQSQLAATKVSEPQAEPLQIEITVERNWSGLLAELRVSGRIAGNRQIEAARCAGLMDALAVTVAMILDQDAEELRASRAASLGPGKVERTTTPAQQAALPGATDREAAAPPQPGAVVERSTRLNDAITPLSSTDTHPGKSDIPAIELRAWLGGGYGSIATAMLQTGVELNLRGWVGQIGGYWQPKHEVAMTLGTLSLSTFGGTLAGCRRFGANWRLNLCLLGSIGAERVRVNSSYIEAATPGLLPVVQLGPSMGIETGGRWVAGVELIEQTAFFRDRFGVVNSAAKHESSIIAIWLMARVALSNRSN